MNKEKENEQKVNEGNNEWMEIRKQGYNSTCWKSELKYIRLRVIEYEKHSSIQRSDLVGCCCLPVMCFVPSLSLTLAHCHIIWLVLHGYFYMPPTLLHFVNARETSTFIRNGTLKKYTCAIHNTSWFSLVHHLGKWPLLPLALSPHR